MLTPSAPLLEWVQTALFMISFTYSWRTDIYVNCGSWSPKSSAMKRGSLFPERLGGRLEVARYQRAENSPGLLKGADWRQRRWEERSRWKLLSARPEERPCGGEGQRLEWDSSIPTQTHTHRLDVERVLQTSQAKLNSVLTQRARVIKSWCQTIWAYHGLTAFTEPVRLACICYN